MRDSTNIMMILEYIPGSSFLEGILNWPRFNENEVKRVVMQLLEALRFCHSKSIIHRVSILSVYRLSSFQPRPQASCLFAIFRLLIFIILEMRGLVYY